MRTTNATNLRGAIPENFREPLLDAAEDTVTSSAKNAFEEKSQPSPVLSKGTLFENWAIFFDDRVRHQKEIPPMAAIADINLRTDASSPAVKNLLPPHIGCEEFTKSESEVEYPMIFDEEPNITYAGSSYEDGAYSDNWYGTLIQPFYGYATDSTYYGDYVSYNNGDYESYKDDVPESLSAPLDVQDYSSRINSLLADICTTILSTRVPFVISISTSERETFFMDGGISQMDTN
jgi:hypothetical protein